ncbi:hypothetical protein LIER_34001 [Lithospermum erythrorhizon]|uniref:Uncharacterized protein n=1 Tax=Lithospermum erythrorhizon TaxID=34254 RepID=A0AAV3S041_LITER
MYGLVRGSLMSQKTHGWPRRGRMRGRRGSGELHSPDRFRSLGRRGCPPNNAFGAGHGRQKQLFGNWKRFDHGFVSQQLPQFFAAMKIEDVDQVTFYPAIGASAHMTDVRLVSQLKQNLLSIHKFCQDNCCTVEFNNHSFLVKDKKTQLPLLKGNNQGYLI